VATTGHGGVISVPQALRIAAEADIVPVVVGDAGGVLGYGLTRRTASTGQRRALAARDRGCSFPGCDRPPDWCETHHVTPWVDGGRTDLQNLTLACGFHHREHRKRPEFKESSQHRVDRGAVTYEIGEGEAAEAGVAGVAAGSA
jgi:hypothetical protein